MNRNAASSTRRAAHRTRPLVGSALGLVVVSVLAAGALASCDSSGGSSGSGSSATSAAPGPASSPAAAPVTTAPATSPAAPTTGTDGSTSGAATSGSATGSGDGSLRVSRCTADELTGSLSAGDGGAAGSTEPFIVLKNTGSKPCALQGWPGVSLVAGGDGTQLGAAATLDRSSPHATVTLIPNGHAHAPLRIAQAMNYPKATCKPEKADGLRVYVPGETHSLFIKASGLTGCANDAVKLLEVQAIQPGTD